MHPVRLVLTVADRDVADVYRAIADFASYPLLSDAVRSVRLSTSAAGVARSEWEVNFRSGVLRWIEEDHFDPDAHRIEFHQCEGDMAMFDGAWRMQAQGPDVTVTFEAVLDMGMPSLADALEPIAARTLATNTIAIVEGLLGAPIVVEEASPPTPIRSHPTLSTPVGGPP